MLDIGLNIDSRSHMALSKSNQIGYINNTDVIRERASKTWFLIKIISVILGVEVFFFLRVRATQIPCTILEF